jgi:hypothetical protein
MTADDRTGDWADFFRNNNLIDRVRKEDFFKVFPELIDIKKYDPT